jgi:hypothetical protein
MGVSSHEAISAVNSIVGKSSRYLGKAHEVPGDH